MGLRAAHNLIHDAPHSAILFGGNDHLCEYNEIHRVCCESHDCGAIYSGRGWTLRGHVIQYNYLHHICGKDGGPCHGIYLVRRNIFWPGSGENLRRVAHGQPIPDNWRDAIAPAVRNLVQLEDNLVNVDFCPRRTYRLSVWIRSPQIAKPNGLLLNAFAPGISALRTWQLRN